MKFRPIPSPFPEMRLVGAKVREYSFIISIDDGEYRASWKNHRHDVTPFGKQLSNFIDGSPFKTFEAAYEACKATYKQLRSKQ